MKASEDTMLRVFPALKGRTVAFDTSASTLEGLIAGNCTQAVMSEDGLTNNKRLKPISPA
eukprot:CAMPEP_0118958296 /NCGR_PEP_ID=MMETSP1169-20130426/62549_1 /TAXON_ID=36882 /ORGANISM="Pyramimonas obovata, Strain CCMP722" /LENGTH=59 /DNA_ID=CAMNT_0006906411 /DNA_START=1682 /DNA_END=1857 /DNA_ORIENTATION=+